MPTLAHIRTWQIVPNIVSYMDPSSATLSNKNFLVVFKNTLTGFTLKPWVVEGSSDSVAFGNNDQVDRWTDNTDIVPSTGNHSWTVLLQTGMGGQASLCLDLDDATANASDVALVFSPSAGFGAANGGTDGTLSARPTATDEIILLEPAARWSDMTNIFNQNVMHIWGSTDGKSMRMVMFNDRAVVTALFLDVAKNPIPEWTSPVVALHSRQTSTILVSADHLVTTNPLSKFRVGSVIGAMNWASAATNTAMINNTTYVVGNDVNGEQLMLPITLASPTHQLRGIWGAMEDLYWGHSLIRFGEKLKDTNGDVQWIAIDDVWMPWSNVAGHMEIH